MWGGQVQYRQCLSLSKMIMKRKVSCECYKSNVFFAFFAAVESSSLQLEARMARLGLASWQFLMFTSGELKCRSRAEGVASAPVAFNERTYIDRVIDDA